MILIKLLFFCCCCKSYSDEEYESVLFQKPTDAVLQKIINGHSGLKQMWEKKELPETTWKKLISYFGVVTCCHSDLLPPGVDAARKAVKKLDEVCLK